MKICVISPGVVHAIPRTAAIAGYFGQVHFVDIRGTSGFANLEGMGVVCHGPADGDPMITGWQLGRLLSRISPDVIVCHYASGDHFFAAVSYGQCPVAVVAMGHDILYMNGNIHVPVLHQKLIKVGLKNTSYISAKSGYLSGIIRKYGVRAPMGINYWGADLKHFQPGAMSEARNRLGLEDRVSVILSPRTVNPTYNIQTIVEAFGLLRKTQSNATLVILGRSDIVYEKKVREVVSGLLSRDSIRFVGEVNQNELPDYYRASDIVVSMAGSEGFPNTLLEAMGCETPILVGDIPQVRELLEDGINARICDIDKTKIAGVLGEMLDDPVGTREMAAKGRETVRHFGDISINGRRFSDEIKRYCKKNARMPLLNRLLFSQLYLLYRVQRKLFT